MNSLFIEYTDELKYQQTSPTKSESPTDSDNSMELFITEGHSTTQSECEFSELKFSDCSDCLSEVLQENGFILDKRLCHTLKGEIMIALDLSQSSEPVCIKKMQICKGKGELAKDALLLDQSANDCFQSGNHLYFVQPMDFGANLKQFVDQCYDYIQDRRLSFKTYRKAIRKLLWELALIIHDFHHNNVFGLDLCAENVFLRNSDFLQNFDGSVTINPDMSCTLIYCGIGETEYIDQTTSVAHDDMYYFGRICYYSFIFQPCDIDVDMNNQYSVINNLKYYFGMHNLLRYVTRTQLLLLQDIMTDNEEKRLKMVTDVLLHKYFRRFSMHLPSN